MDERAGERQQSVIAAITGYWTAAATKFRSSALSIASTNAMFALPDVTHGTSTNVFGQAAHQKSSSYDARIDARL